MGLGLGAHQPGYFGEGVPGDPGAVQQKLDPQTEPGGREPCPGLQGEGQRAPTPKAGPGWDPRADADTRTDPRRAPGRTCRRPHPCSLSAWARLLCPSSPSPLSRETGGPTKGVRTWSPRQPPGQDLRGPEHTLGTPVTGTPTPTEPCVTASSRKPIAPSHLPSSTACLLPAPAQAAAGCPTLTGVPWGGTCSLPVGPELGGWVVGTASSREQGPPVHPHEGGTRGAR